MKAVILVGGEGTRLRPLTCNTPKAMVPLLNRPFIEHLLRYLKKHGVTDVILTMGYLPDPIESFLGDGVALGVKVTYVVEESPLGTAGAVKNVESLLDGPFVVFNGDILTEIDLTAIMKLHRQIKPRVTIALTPVDNPTLYGVVETDSQGLVKRFVEKPSWDRVTTNMINAGIYVLEPDVLAYIPSSTRLMFEHHVFPQLLDMGKPIMSFPSDAYWIDIGTPEKYLKANHDLLLRWNDRAVRSEGKSEIHPASRIEGPVLIGEECVIDADAEIKGPTVIGPRCQISRGAVIDKAVLWEGTLVADKAIIRNSVVGSRGRIESDCYIPEYCVLGDNVTLGKGRRLSPGAEVWPNSHVEPDTSNP